MEKARTSLKFSSLSVLALAVISLATIVAGLMSSEFNSAELPAGSPENLMTITKIIILVVTLVLLIPRVYVGFKGLKIAKNPDSSKGHITWAVILLVFAIISLIEPVTNMVKSGSLSGYWSTFYGPALDAVVFLEYIKEARTVAKAAAQGN